MASRLCEVCNLFGYGEIVPCYYLAGSTVKTEFQKYIKSDKFIVITMSGKEDIIKGIKRLLEKEGDRSWNA